jgi:hypothetical protein
MILYVNGDSHAAAAEAVVPHAWAEDDEFLWGMGRQAHPTNAQASFGCELANHLFAVLDLDAQAGGSNARIIRTTRDWIRSNQNNLSDTFVLIQWSTWEREEWFYNDVWWQVNASGWDHVPPELTQRYKEFVANIDWVKCTRQAHEDIWNFHCELEQQGIRHLFFNANSHFAMPVLNNRNRFDPVILPEDQKDWGTSYLGPYDAELTYDRVLKNNGFEYKNPASYHFGADAHCFWAEYLLQYIKRNQLLRPDEIPSY